MIDTKKYDTYQVKFQWEITFYTSKTTTGLKGFRPFSLINVQKINDYENNFFPIFKIDARIQDRWFDAIFQNQNKLIANLKVYKQLFSAEEEDTTTSKKAIKETLVINNEKYVAFFSNLPIDYMGSDKLMKSEDINKDTQSPENEDDSDMSDAHTTRSTIYLFHLSSLLTYKKFYNYVLDNASVNAALALIIDKSNFIEEAIVDTPDNSVKYTNLIMPPYNLRNSFYSLQYRYGVYANGMNLFLDQKRLYCLKALSVNHEQYSKSNCEFTRLKMYNTQNTIHFPYIMGIHKEDGSYLFESDTKLTKQNYDVILGEIQGDTMVYSNFNQILECVEGNGTLNSKAYTPTKEITLGKRSHQDTGIKMDIEYDELNNGFNMLSEVRKNNANMVVPVVVHGVDLDVFSPEKKVILSIDDTVKNIKYGGDYCIRNVIYQFTADNNVQNMFSTTCSAKVTLCKVPDDLK